MGFWETHNEVEGVSMLKRMMGSLAILMGMVGWTTAGDWPQWRGPEGNGHANEKGLLKEWPKSGPELVWTFDQGGSGYSAPAVVGERIYLPGCEGEDEKVIALDTTGKRLWEAPIGKTFDFKGNAWSKGPNGTPYVDGDLLYTVGSQGILVCVRTKDGKVVWSQDLRKTLSAQVNPVGGGAPDMGWGFSWSPIVDGDQLVLTPGGPKGLFAALDKKTGKLLWQSKAITDQATYVTAQIVEIEGTKQYLTMVQDGVLAVDPKNGALLWRYKASSAYRDIVATSPVVWDNNVLITSIGGTEIVTVTKDGGNFTAKSTQRSRRLSNLHSGVVKVEGYLYGSDDSRGWKCFDLKSIRNAVWEAAPRDPKGGSLSYADGNLYCLSDKTNMVSLVEATSKEYTLKGSFTLPKVSKLRKTNAKLWTHPVIANGMLYVRDQELLYCYKVK